MTGRYVPSSGRLKIGHITPSSNTVLEPLTGLISRALDDRVSHHFTRLKVQSISLEPLYLDQFKPETMMAAAELLSDAGVDAIVWNGTSGSWKGLEADRELCALISERTGIPASTATLAALEAVERSGFSRCGLAVPYTTDVTAQIRAVYGRAGLEVVGSAHAGVSANREMAHVSEARIRSLIRDADAPSAQCVLLICTGLAGAQLVAELEHELGKPIFDSVAVTLWKALMMVGVEPRLSGWGSLLAGRPVPLSRAL